MKFILVCVLTFSAAALGMLTVRGLGWPYWTYHLLVIAVGVILYVINGFLIIKFIRKRAPEYASSEEVLPGVQKWELTAGTGVVPKWVSYIGLASIPFLLASPLELIAWLMRTL